MLVMEVRTVEEAVATLETLHNQAGVRTKVIVVGHSYPVAYEAAIRFSQEVFYITCDDMEQITVRRGNLQVKAMKTGDGRLIAREKAEVLVVVNSQLDTETHNRMRGLRMGGDW